jgi:hypothetical protein
MKRGDHSHLRIAAAINSIRNPLYRLNFLDFGAASTSKVNCDCSPRNAEYKD